MDQKQSDASHSPRTSHVSHHQTHHGQSMDRAWTEHGHQHQLCIECEAVCCEPQSTPWWSLCIQFFEPQARRKKHGKQHANNTFGLAAICPVDLVDSTEFYLRENRPVGSNRARYRGITVTRHWEKDIAVIIIIIIIIIMMIIYSYHYCITSYDVL